MNSYLQPAAARLNIGRSGRARQRGLSLIEFLIAITLGLMIVAALTLLIAQQSATQAEFEKSSRQIENGRYAMQILNDEIQLAGYYGEFFDVASLPLPGALPDPCSTTVADISLAMKYAVQGYDSPASPAGLVSCIDPANHVPGTDILVVRRTDTTTLTLAAAASGATGQIYLQAGTLPPTVGASGLVRLMGKGSDVGGGLFNLRKRGPEEPSFLRKFLVNIFFVSPCSVPVGATCTSAADGGKPIPTLKMVALTTVGGAVAFTTTPLVEGIENLQIDYGFDNVMVVGTIPPVGDGSPDGQYLSTAPAVVLEQWAQVVALRVHVLARNNESSPGYSDAKTYSLGYKNGASAQQVTASTDSYGNNVLAFKRRVFSQAIRLVTASDRTIANRI